MRWSPIGLRGGKGDPHGSVVIQRFQNLNVVPRRICAEFGSDDRVHIEVDVCGMTAEQLSLIASKISQSPSIHRAHWHRLS
jgi:hypothetical protein